MVWGCVFIPGFGRGLIVGGVVDTLVVTMYVNVTVPTRTRLVGFNIGNNMGLTGTSFGGSSLGASGFAKFFVNPVTRIAVPLVNLKISTSLLFSRENIGIDDQSFVSPLTSDSPVVKGHAVERGNLSVPVGLGCAVNLNDSLNVCMTTNPSFCFGFSKSGICRGCKQLGGGGTRVKVGMNTNIGLLERLRMNTGCGVPLGGATR